MDFTKHFFHYGQVILKPIERQGKFPFSKYALRNVFMPAYYTEMFRIFTQLSTFVGHSW